MAARVLPFRSLASAGHPVGGASITGSIRSHHRHSSSKVLSMSKQTHRRQTQDTAVPTATMLAKVEQEMAQDYVEVELSGISLARLLCVYQVCAREARARTMDSLKSLLRLTPAH